MAILFYLSTAAYETPLGDMVNFSFEGGYTPPEGDGVDFDFD